MSALEARVSMTELARLADVSVAAVSNWRRRHSDFPSSHSVLGQELFRLADVVDWLNRRKIARKDLKDGEPPGMTYGVRLLRKLGVVDDAGPASEVGVLTQPVATWSASLWRVLNRMRGRYDVSSYADIVLGMIYLRVCGPEQWRKLVAAAGSKSSASAVWELLDRTSLPGDWSVPDTRLFPYLIPRSEIEHTLGEIIRNLDRIDLGGPIDDSSPGSRHAAELFGHLLSQFERTEGLAGQYLTPPSLIRVMVEMLDPQPDEYIHDPCCGCGEMLAGVLAYVEGRGGTFHSLSVSGHALTERSLRLATLNMALHGITTNLDLRFTNTLHGTAEHDRYFDVVLTNPPFNMSDWAADDAWHRRWHFGTPPAHNANFAWLQDVLSALSSRGRAGILMPNGAASSDHAREATIRAAMVDARVVDCVVALPAQLFRSTGIPVMLWLLSRGNGKQSPGILFIDATAAGSMVDRVQRDLTNSDIAQISNEYHLWRNRRSLEHHKGSEGFSRPVSWQEIREKDYVLNPRTYVNNKRLQLDVAGSVGLIKELRIYLRNLHERSVEADALVDERLARFGEWKP